jgi:hypothetical protein
MDLFAELLPNPLLEHFAIPDDALIKIVSQMDSKLLLFIWTQHRGCARVVRPAIPQTIQAQGVIALQDDARPRDGIPGQLQKFSFRFAFGKEGKKLRPAPLDGAGTGPEDGPEVIGGVLELNGRVEFFDLDSLHDLIGVRIIRIPFVSLTNRDGAGLPTPRPEPVSLPLASLGTNRSCKRFIRSLYKMPPRWAWSWWWSSGPKARKALSYFQGDGWWNARLPGFQDLDGWDVIWSV